MTPRKRLARVSTGAMVRKWVRQAPYPDDRFIRLDFNAFSNTFAAVGCEGDKRDYSVIVSTTSGRTPESAIRNMLKRLARGG